MHVFSLEREQQWDPKHHVEKILGKVADGDRRVLGARPDQPPTEIYFCFTGGGTMRTPKQTVAVAPGAFIVHPPGEVHEYANGPARTLLFRVRYGADMRAHHVEWRGNKEWKQSAADADYYRQHPIA